MIPSEINFVRIGRSRKSFGAGGQLRCSIDWNSVKSLGKGDFIFFEIDGIKIPFQIESMNDADSPLLKLADINDPQAALLITNKELFLEEKKSKVGVDPSIPFDHLIGYSVFDQVSGQEVGTISRVEEMPGQVMAIILRDGEPERMIPLVSDFIVDQNDVSKVLTMSLPEGMLDL